MDLPYDAPDNSKERITLNTYSYEYSFDENKLGLDFSEGRDNRKNYTKLEKEIRC